MNTRRICVVGAGYISNVHAEVLTSLPGVSISAIVDCRERAARAFADRWNVPISYTDVKDVIENDAADAVHVLTSPNTHFEVARPVVSAGLPVFVEKPLAVSEAQCKELVDLARSTGTPLIVNQNSLFHPAFVSLSKIKSAQGLGRLRSLDCMYTMPLRQLATQQFGHWMFSEPQNILLEQAVHPLAQLAFLGGPVTDVSGVSGDPFEISPGRFLYKDVNLVLKCEKVSTLLRFSIGSAYPVWLIVASFDDGLVIADMVANRTQVYNRTPWLEPVDQLVTGLRGGGQIGWGSFRNATDYACNLLRIKKRSDPFYKSMWGSIYDFYQMIEKNTEPVSSGAFGHSIVRICEKVSTDIFPRPETARTKPLSKDNSSHADVLILGGTGFIGRYFVEHCLSKGQSVRVMARNTANLSATFFSDRVSVVKGDVTSAEDVANVIDNVDRVVNLAHGGGGETWSEVREAMVQSAITVGRVCIEKKVRRLVHVSSIAALYLGNKDAVITNKTCVDPKPHLRSLYSRGKVEAEIQLLKLHEKEELSLCIVRPGIVLGEGTTPFHSGIGYYNNEQHCLGWNRGQNPLPLVLVEDVAAGIASALYGADLNGRCFNLIGDIRFSASRYTEILASKTERPLQFHGQRPEMLWLVETLKWLIKRVGGRKADRVTYHDLLSRGLVSTFNCSDTMTELAWNPIADPGEFIDRAFGH